MEIGWSFLYLFSLKADLTKISSSILLSWSTMIVQGSFRDCTAQMGKVLRASLLCQEVRGICWSLGYLWSVLCRRFHLLLQNPLTPPRRFRPGFRSRVFIFPEWVRVLLGYRTKHWCLMSSSFYSFPFFSSSFFSKAFSRAYAELDTFKSTSFKIVRNSLAWLDFKFWCF